MAGHFLDEVGHFLEVGEGPVGFEHRELRIVAARDAFVAEIAVEFEDLGEATDEQALEEKLRRDAQGERHAERVVMRLERPRRGTAGDVLEHRRFHFEETAVLEETADFREHQRAGDEERGAVRVAHQVEVALAVFRFAVGEAVELVGHRAQGLGEHGEVFHLHGGFAGAGEEGFALDADPVAAVEALPCGGLFFGEILDADVALDRAEHVAELEEHGLAHVAQGDDAAGDFHLLGFLEIRAEFGGSGGNLEARTVGIDAEIAEFREFLAADGDEFGFGGLGLLRRGGFGHGADGLGGGKVRPQESKPQKRKKSPNTRKRSVSGISRAESLKCRKR